MRKVFKVHECFIRSDENKSRHKEGKVRVLFKYVYHRVTVNGVCLMVAKLLTRSVIQVFIFISF